MFFAFFLSFYIPTPCLANILQVVLFTPGEIAADEYVGYLTNLTITGLFAEEINGAVVLLERESLIVSSLTRCP
jgi:hypothetical protein